MIRLPIEDVIAPLIAALQNAGVAVLQAPPGAGKTTRVPLAMHDAGIVTGKIIMLEPRRLAARAAAERMAQTLNEAVGQTVGYRMRGDSKSGRETKIEVVTEGILTRMIQSDPELTGIGAVIFDEFHERSLNGDLGLGLTWEARQVLRPDLKILVMSATLDAEPIARMLDDAPIITSLGRAFRVENRWLDTPLRKGRKLEVATAELITHAYNTEEGSILVFLPGEREIRATARLLDLPNVKPLFGALPFSEQRAAIAASKTRKIVLATSIAETSLTIEDVCIVIDAGLARRARFDPGSGMSKLVTEKVSRAEATQRAGRAGRVSEGVCFRLWSRAEEGALPAFPPAEIEAADLTALALELAAWGAQPQDLALLTQPPSHAFAEAQSLLRNFNAFDDNGITTYGKALVRIPTHPRLAHMLLNADRSAGSLASLLSGRDGGRDTDLSKRMATMPHDMRRDASRLAKFAGSTPRSLAEQAALAYPDRIGLRRPGDAPRYVLSGGKGAKFEDGDTLAGQRLIVTLDLDGDIREARIRLATPIAESELRGLFEDQIHWIPICEWSKRDRRVLARQQERLGALILQDRIWKDAPDDAIANALMDGARSLGLSCLNWSKSANLLRARVVAADLKDWSDTALLNSLEDWLLPHAMGRKTAADLKQIDLVQALRTNLSYPDMQALDRAAPPKFVTPLGREIPIDYAGETPAIEVRLQELFGTTIHPKVGQTPIKVTLLSPGHKAVQVTTDLPGFWASSYTDVRKDMRGRYPKHPWPEDPTQADPTLRAKPRKRP
ncbi:MAG: ATP-dependent helicase HrpB [Litoreibacter sp.]